MYKCGFQNIYSDSAIGQHLLNNPECGQDYHAEWFQIVACERTEAHEENHLRRFSLHLCIKYIMQFFPTPLSSQG